MWEDAEWQGADRVIAQELTEGEELLWAGQPRQGVVLRGSDAFFIPFSLVWCGFLAVLVALTLTSESWFMAIFAIPFAVAGAYALLGRFWVDARHRAKTYYGVTDERVIIISGIFRREVKSLSLRTLTDVSLTEKADGSGTISLGTAHPMFESFRGLPLPNMKQLACPTLEMIDNAREVYEVIRQAQRADQQTPA